MDLPSAYHEDENTPSRGALLCRDACRLAARNFSRYGRAMLPGFLRTIPKLRQLVEVPFKGDPYILCSFGSQFRDPLGHLRVSH